MAVPTIEDDMVLPLPKPCIVCGTLTRPGAVRCDNHAIRRTGRRKLPAGRYRCASCKGAFSAAAVEIDHIVPLWAGGDPDDTQVLCTPCHRDKTQDDLTRYRPG